MTNIKIEKLEKAQKRIAPNGTIILTTHKLIAFGEEYTRGDLQKVTNIMNRINNDPELKQYARRCAERANKMIRPFEL
jgi:cell fate (sporulation/competence/biofilm development) regulator YlbF (YheA/YmcA/DUF963 family)